VSARKRACARAIGVAVAAAVVVEETGGMGVGALYIIIEVLLGYVSDLLFHLAHDFCAVIEDILQVLQARKFKDQAITVRQDSEVGAPLPARPPPQTH
jgi:hypothetical protein